MSPRLLTRERSLVGGKPWDVESARAPMASCVTVAGSGIARRPCSARASGRLRSPTHPGVCARSTRPAMSGIVDRERQFCLSRVLTEYRQRLEIDPGVREAPLATSGGPQRCGRSAGRGAARAVPVPFFRLRTPATVR